jgi:hypothetical protein
MFENKKTTDNNRNTRAKPSLTCFIEKIPILLRKPRNIKPASELRSDENCCYH